MITREFWEDGKGSLGYFFFVVFFFWLQPKNWYRSIAWFSVFLFFFFHGFIFSMRSLLFFLAFLHKVAASLYDSISDTIAYLLSLGRMHRKDCPLSLLMYSIIIDLLQRQNPIHDIFSKDKKE